MAGNARYIGGEGDALDRLICADNLEAMAATRDGCCDLIYVDPPFGTGTEQKRGGARYADPMREPQAFVGWLEPRLREMHRLLRPSGSLFVHLDYRTVHYVKIALDRIFGRDRMVNEIIWCYSVGGKSRRTFGRKHDTLLWFSRSRDYAFYPNAVRIPRRGGSHMRVVETETGERVQEKTDRKTGRVYRYPVSQGKLPEDWWSDIETLNRSDRERVGWPSQKPSRLLRRIIDATTQPGDWVADYFCGSGTTCAVAHAGGRRVIGVDSEPGAIAVASERLRTRHLGPGETCADLAVGTLDAPQRYRWVGPRSEAIGEAWDDAGAPDTAEGSR